MSHIIKKPAIHLSGIIIPALLFFLSCQTVFAQAVTLPNNPASKILDRGEGLPSAIINIFIPSFLSILSFVALIYMFLAGLKYIRSRGDPKSAAEARSRMIFAVFGMVVIILSAAASQLIDKLLLNSRTF